MAFGYRLSQDELDALAEQQATDDAATAPVPPPYDPAQDTQGMQAQPAAITVAPPATDPTQSAEASYQQAIYNMQIQQPGPEYDIQTIVTPPPVPSTLYGGPADPDVLRTSPQSYPRAIETTHPSTGAGPTVRTLPPRGSTYQPRDVPREVYTISPPHTFDRYGAFDGHRTFDRNETLVNLGALLWFMDRRRQRQRLRGLFGGQADPVPAPRPPVGVVRDQPDLTPGTLPWWLGEDDPRSP